MSRRARTPGFVYGALFAIIAVVMATLALSATQPPPPTVAEFAPQAVEQIDEAPDEQSSDFGSAPGSGGGQATPTPEVIVETPRTRRCVGDPPRQTEDPQSPPCVPYWEGDNGGATYQGVTGDTISIVIPTEREKSDAVFEPLKEHFNSRFEFYGRKLEFTYIQDGLGTSPPENQQAEAQQADEEIQAFASSFYRASQGLYYHEELARRQVLSVTGSLYPFPSDYLDRFTPYLWQHPMESDLIFSNMGEWACKRITGRKAEFGGAEFVDRERVLGIIVQTYYDGDPNDTPTLERALADCGYPVPPERKVRNGVRQDQGGERTQVAAVDPVTSSNVILQMKSNDVTTIFCPCNLFTAGALMKAATNQNYFPEWIFTSYGPMDINVAPSLGAAPPEQMEHAFGLTFAPRQVRPEEEPYWWAIQESRPDVNQPRDAANVGNRYEIYRPLLVLASGIQMAGPNLTPETFAAGLRRASFPNPDHPNMAGDVGFAPSSSAMALDGTEIWWLNAGPSPYDGGDYGTYCYIDGGKRYALGEWPEGRGQLFETPCDSGA